MMKVQPTTSVTIDDTTFAVENMSKECQTIIKFIDELRQRREDTTTELLIVDGALRDAQNQLLAQLQKERSEVSESANEGTTPAAAVQ